MFSKISMIHNYDGCHTSKAFLCYMNCDPLVAMSILMGDYYISGYNGEELYSMSYVGYKYALAIDPEDVDNDDEFIMSNIMHIEPFVPDYVNIERPIFKLAKAGVNTSYDADYSLRLSMLFESNKDVSKAATLNSLITKEISNTPVDFNNINEWSNNLFKIRTDLASAGISKADERKLFVYILSRKISRNEEI